MKLLCISNGHGEDAIALRILQQLRALPHAPELAAMSLVGEGSAYTHANIPLIGPAKRLPSGGFIYMDGRQLARDLQGGLVALTLAQLRTVKAWAQEGGAVLAVGDIVPLLFAWYGGAPYAFVGTAKSEYYLRDEAGVLPRPTWFDRLENLWGSVYLPWERWLMEHPRCRAVYPRDRLTADTLRRWDLPVFDLGNPMMDGLEPTGDLELPPHGNPLTLLLLPGSRPPEVYTNWQIILEGVESLLARSPAPLMFLGAIAPSLDPDPLHHALTERGWQRRANGRYFQRSQSTLLLDQAHFGDCLHRADVALAMAGTATEQFVGLGKPAFIYPGPGPQFTPAFAEAQTRLLGPSAILVKHPHHTADAVDRLMHDPDRLQLIADNGDRRMGQPGAAARIADSVMTQLYNI
ncbi:MAG: lipid-A-disaccharide synthase-related protein [Kaiparowitsia implicata GSE-PSE-MK54-09C]|jgi:uncharacterized protein (TIGR03492 family)|nr:lipid-A-disaccharide synthase-related protein [Kaiparowitsia implicata GSE-PSE-MK54-09C]